MYNPCLNIDGVLAVRWDFLGVTNIAKPNDSVNPCIRGSNPIRMG